jgi:hypothetical protein
MERIAGQGKKYRRRERKGHPLTLAATRTPIQQPARQWQPDREVNRPAESIMGGTEGEKKEKIDGRKRIEGGRRRGAHPPQYPPRHPVGGKHQLLCAAGMQPESTSSLKLKLYAYLRDMGSETTIQQTTTPHRTTLACSFYHPKAKRRSYRARAAPAVPASSCFSPSPAQPQKLQSNGGNGGQICKWGASVRVGGARKGKAGAQRGALRCCCQSLLYNMPF